MKREMIGLIVKREDGSTTSDSGVKMSICLISKYVPSEIPDSYRLIP